MHAGREGAGRQAGRQADRSHKHAGREKGRQGCMPEGRQAGMHARRVFS